MIWWVLTYLDNYRLQTSLDVLAKTNLQAHLFMKWSRFKPSRRPVYKRVRGVNVWCGYEYIWDTPNLVEQSQPGSTFEHLFTAIRLSPADHVWYYLFSIGEKPYKECQGPLIHVPPPEVPMISARIFHSANQDIPGMAPTVVTFDSELWDDADFHSAANPTRLTIPLPGRYLVGVSTFWLMPAPTGLRVGLRINGATEIARHSYWTNVAGWADVDISVATLYQFDAGDYVEVLVYNTNVAARRLWANVNYSPHFWAIYQGPLP